MDARDPLPNLSARTARALRVTALAALICLGTPAWAATEVDKAAIRKQIDARLDTSIKELQDWIALPSIAAEDLNMQEGAEYMAKLARDAGFQHAEVIQTSGDPGVFATLDAGAPTTLGVYFMYDVKQFDPAEWIAPPLSAQIIERPGVGKVMIGRGVVNQKGPQLAFLQAVRAIQDAGQKLPVNLVLVAEGEEEIGSPNIRDLVDHPKVQPALARTIGVFMPHAMQGVDGQVTVHLGAKGVIELELIASGERWGRGPSKDIHSSYKAMVDAPAWRLVKALDTLVSEDGNTITIENFPVAPPLSEEHRAMIAAATAGSNEDSVKKQLGVSRWIDDLPWQQARERLVSQPTVNIEGLVGGYTGPGGKTVLPHRAVAKIDIRLVPGMRFDDAVAALKAHLAKQGYGDIEVNVSGGYNPTQTKADAGLIQAALQVLRDRGEQPLLWPLLAGSYPGFAFTDPPLNLPSGHFGLSHGGAQHAPDEYLVIESSNPKIEGYGGAVMSYVDYLYALTRQ